MNTTYIFKIIIGLFALMLALTGCETVGDETATSIFAEATANPTPWTTRLVGREPLPTARPYPTVDAEISQLRQEVTGLKETVTALNIRPIPTTGFTPTARPYPTVDAEISQLRQEVTGLKETVTALSIRPNPTPAPNTSVLQIANLKKCISWMAGQRHSHTFSYTAPETSYLGSGVESHTHSAYASIPSYGSSIWIDIGTTGSYSFGNGTTTKNSSTDNEYPFGSLFSMPSYCK